MQRSTAWIPAPLALVALVALASPGLRADDPPEARQKLELDAGAGELRLLVKKKGALKAFAHDHEFDVRGYTGTVVHDPAEPAKGSVEIHIPSKDVTLLQDGKLSPADHAKVQDQTLSDVILDVKKFPEIVFVSSSVVVHEREKDGPLPLSVLGTLTLHGVSKQRTLEVRLVVAKSGDLEISGEHAFNQSDFGIEPYSTAFGMVGVQDEVSFKFRIVARRPTKPAAAGPATGAAPAASPAAPEKKPVAPEPKKKEGE